jgi:hypothetical protein
MLFKVKGVEGSQNLERKTIHLQAGHVGIDRHFVDWRVKGIEFPNLSKSRFNLSRQIKVESGPLIPDHVGVLGIESWRCQGILTSRISISRYAKS